MPLRLLKDGSPALARFLGALAQRRGDDNAAVDDTVRRIISEVRRGGDRALVRLTRQFDGFKLERTKLRVSPRSTKSSIVKANRLRFSNATNSAR